MEVQDTGDQTEVYHMQGFNLNTTFLLCVFPTFLVLNITKYMMLPYGVNEIWDAMQ